MENNENVWQSILKGVPVVVIAMASAYMSSQIAISTHATRLEFIDEDITEIKSILVELSSSQIEIARQAEWMRGQERRMMVIEDYIAILKSRTNDSYSRTEAKKDLDVLRRDINELSRQE